MTNPTDPLAAAQRVKELAAKASEGWAAWWRDATGSNDWAGKAMVAGLPFTAVDRMPAFHRDDAIYIAEARILAPILADAVLAHARTTRERADLNLALAAENERLKSEIGAVIASTGCEVRVREGGGPENLAASLAVSVAKLKSERDKLQAFKTWVHDFLDGKGIHHHPPGTHGAAGCRIGDRMDYVFAEMERLKKRGAGLEDQLVRIAAHIGKDARHAPETDATVAGAVIVEIGRLRASLERIQRASTCAGTDDPEAIEGIARAALAAAPPPGADADIDLSDNDIKEILALPFRPVKTADADSPEGRKQS